jgi:hypothetical protein
MAAEGERKRREGMRVREKERVKGRGKSLASRFLIKTLYLESIFKRISLKSPIIKIATC